MWGKGKGGGGRRGSLETVLEGVCSVSFYDECHLLPTLPLHSGSILYAPNVRQFLKCTFIWLSQVFCEVGKIVNLMLQMNTFVQGLPGGASGKEPTCQCRRCKRHGFDPLGREDPLEEGMATHSSIFAWRIPWTEEPNRLKSIRLPRAGHDWSNWASTHAHSRKYYKQWHTNKFKI